MLWFFGHTGIVAVQSIYKPQPKIKIPPSKNKIITIAPSTAIVIKTAPYILPDIRLIAQSLMIAMLDATKLDAGISII